MAYDELAAIARSRSLPMSTKAAALHEQLTKRQAKAAHLQSEIERIVSKEGGEDGLSDGQRRQVERNTSRLTELDAQMGGLKEQLSEGLRAQLSEAALVGDARATGAPDRKRRRGGGGGGGSDDGRLRRRRRRRLFRPHPPPRA